MAAENNHSEGYVPKINEFAQNYIEELKKEQERLSDDFPMISELIHDAIDRIYQTGRTPGKELRADVFKQKPIKLSQNVYLPVKQYPKFNFQGKILGPKGNTLKRLHQETMCSIAVKGRHSMRDQNREEELRQTNDPAFNHLNKSLFVEISTVAPPAEAYARIAYALSEIRKYIIPDKNDEISQEQYRELMEIDPSMAKNTYGFNKQMTGQKSVLSKMGFNNNARQQYESNSGNEVDGDEQVEIKPKKSFNSQATAFKRKDPSTFVAKNLRNTRNAPYAKTPVKTK